MIQGLIHYFLHLGFPVVIALVFFRENWKKAYLILLATMLVDLDHLLATPIFRCGALQHSVPSLAHLLCHIRVCSPPFFQEAIPYYWRGPLISHANRPDRLHDDLFAMSSVFGGFAGDRSYWKCWASFSYCETWGISIFPGEENSG
jgi:hypothetical protein